MNDVPRHVAEYCNEARAILDGDREMTIAEAVAFLHNDEWIAYWYMKAPRHVKQHVRVVLPELFQAHPPTYPDWAKRK